MNKWMQEIWTERQMYVVKDRARRETDRRQRNGEKTWYGIEWQQDGKNILRNNTEQLGRREREGGEGDRERKGEWEREERERER